MGLKIVGIVHIATLFDLSARRDFALAASICQEFFERVVVHRGRLPVGQIDSKLFLPSVACVLRGSALRRDFLELSEFATATARRRVAPIPASRLLSSDGLRAQI